MNFGVRLGHFGISGNRLLCFFIFGNAEIAFAQHVIAHGKNGSVNGESFFKWSYCFLHFILLCKDLSHKEIRFSKLIFALNKVF